MTLAASKATLYNYVMNSIYLKAFKQLYGGMKHYERLSKE